MRSNDRLRTLWRNVAEPVPVSDAQLDRLATHIGRDAERALHARTKWMRTAAVVGVAAAVIAAVAVAVMPPQPPRPAATLIEMPSGREIPDGAWVIAAAIRTAEQ